MSFQSKQRNEWKRFFLWERLSKNCTLSTKAYSCVFFQTCCWKKMDSQQGVYQSGSQSFTRTLRVRDFLLMSSVSIAQAKVIVAQVAIITSSSSIFEKLYCVLSLFKWFKYFWFYFWTCFLKILLCIFYKNNKRIINVAFLKCFILIKFLRVRLWRITEKQQNSVLFFSIILSCNGPLRKIFNHNHKNTFIFTKFLFWIVSFKWVK